MEKLAQRFFLPCGVPCRALLQLKLAFTPFFLAFLYANLLYITFILGF